MNFTRLTYSERLRLRGLGRGQGPHAGRVLSQQAVEVPDLVLGQRVAQQVRGLEQGPRGVRRLAERDRHLLIAPESVHGRDLKRDPVRTGDTLHDHAVQLPGAGLFRRALVRFQDLVPGQGP
jgi:hypothetical protein